MNNIISSCIRSTLKKRSALNCLIEVNRSLQTVSRSPESERKIGLNGIFLLLIPIGTFGLGTWQVQRRKWKLGLIKVLESKTSEPPIPFPSNLQEIELLEYRKVIVRGEFDHSQEMYVGPRPLMVGGDISEKGGGLISTGQSGYNVITPLILSDNKSKILVNRGWVSRKSLKPSQRLDGQISGPVEFMAIVRKHEERSPFMPDNVANTNVYAYRDVIKMAKASGSAPAWVDSVDSFEGGPVGGQTRVTLRNEHMSYIMTWYSLSVATSFLWVRKFIFKKPLM